MSLNIEANGYLTPGIHQAKISEVRLRFVVQFSRSNTRSAIFEGYERYITQLLADVSSAKQFLNGSFVSSKNDPGDIDIVTFADADMIDALPYEAQLRLEALFDAESAKANYSCDAYFCPILPEGHPDHARTRASRKYWMGEFGYDRVDNPKGIIEVSISRNGEQ